MAELKNDQIINRRQLHELVPYSDIHLLRMEKLGRFPQRVKLGKNRVGWVLREVLQWIDDRKTEREPAINADATGGI